MSSDFNFTVTSWFLGNPISTHSGKVKVFLFRRPQKCEEMFLSCQITKVTSKLRVRFCDKVSILWKDFCTLEGNGIIQVCM